MFQRIVIAYDESPEADRAFQTAIKLAKIFGATLRAITVIEQLPVYTAYVAATDSSMLQKLYEDRRTGCAELQARAQKKALRDGVDLTTVLIEGAEVRTIVDFVLNQRADLLVIGLSPHKSNIASLWSSVYAIAEAIPCSVLGVH